MYLVIANEGNVISMSQQRAIYNINNNTACLQYISIHGSTIDKNIKKCDVYVFKRPYLLRTAAMLSQKHPKSAGI